MLPTDLTGNYTHLADYYEEKGSSRKLEDLSALAEKNLTGYARDTVLKKISSMKEKNGELSH